MGSFSIVTGYQHFQSGTLMPVGEKGSIPLLQSEHENKWQQWGKNLSGGSWPDVLSGLRAALQPLKKSGFGDRLLTGAASYSHNRPKAAIEALINRAA